MRKHFGRPCATFDFLVFGGHTLLQAEMDDTQWYLMGFTSATHLNGLSLSLLVVLLRWQSLGRGGMKDGTRRNLRLDRDP